MIGNKIADRITKVSKHSNKIIWRQMRIIKKYLKKYIYIYFICIYIKYTEIYIYIYIYIYFIYIYPEKRPEIIDKLDMNIKV